MIRIPFIPGRHQLVIVRHIIDTMRCAIWAGMGMGKTSATLYALNLLSLVEDVYPVLVLAPLRVAQSTWPDEVAKWEGFEDIEIVTIIGDEKTRSRAAAKAVFNSEYDLAPPSIFTVNYENMPWLMTTLAASGLPWPFKTIVADESTKLKGFRLRQGTQRAKALARHAHQAGRFIELTGTPSPNGLRDLWGQSWFLDAGVRLGRTYDAFSQRWFQRSFDGYGMDPLPIAQGEIEAKLKDICISVNPIDYFPIEEPIEVPVYVDLPPKARVIYDEMEKKMFTEIAGEEVEAFNAAAKTMKCLQIANGAAYIGEDAKEWKEVHDEKIKALEDIIEEAAGMPVLVAYHFRSDLERLRRAFPLGRVLDKNPQTIRDWNAGKIPVLFAHPASAGHGISLQDGGNIIAFFSLNWDMEQYTQIIERIGPVRQMQSGHKRAVFVYHILGRDTVDEMVLDRLKSKKDIQSVLLEAMKRKEK